MRIDMETLRACVAAVANIRSETHEGLEYHESETPPEQAYKDGWDEACAAVDYILRGFARIEP